MSDDHYEGTPGAKTKGQLTVYQEFEAELSERAHAIFSMLPSNVSPEKFRNTAIAAVKQNPELLACNPRTLFASITRAAQDGLMPDGKESVIQPYNVKVSKKDQPDRWEKQAQYQPMFHGMRKRARELDSLLVDAQVVHEKDLFKRIQGDEPSIVHEPAQLGTPRGKMIGAYAIFKREDKTIIAREVMDADAIEAVRQTSRNKDGLMWKTFTTEAWRKTVGRRGFKAVPAISPELEGILKRDDEANFDFSGDRTPAEVLTPPPAPKPAEIEHKPGEVLTQADKAALGAAMKPEAEKAPRRKKGENRGAAKAAEAPQPEPQANGPDPNDPRFKTADEWKAEADATAPAGDSEDPRVEGIETAGILADEWQEYFDMMEGEVKGARDATQEAQTHEAVTDHIQSNLERGKIDRALHERLNDEWARRTGSKA